MNELLTQYPREIAAILARYPAGYKRSAVMPLLSLAQGRQNYITKQTILDIAEILEMSTTDVDAVVGFYTLFHDQPGGRYRIQVCTDLPCALKGADEFLQALCGNLAVRLGEITADGLFSVEEVTCLAGCHRAPLFQVQSDGEITYHEEQTIESAMQVVETLRADANGEVKT